MDEFVYTVLYKRQILSGEKGIYQFIPCYVVKGFYDVEEHSFLDEMNKIRYLMEDCHIIEEHCDYCIGEVYTEKDLYHKYPDVINLETAKIKLFEEEEKSITIGVYREDKDQIKVLKYINDKLENPFFENSLKHNDKEETFDLSTVDTVVLPKHLEEMMQITDTSMMYQFLRSLRNNRTREEPQIKKMDNEIVLNFDSKDIDKLIEKEYSCDDIKIYFQQIYDLSKSILEEYSNSQMLDIEKSDFLIHNNPSEETEDELEEDGLEEINIFDIDSLLIKIEDIKNKVWNANYLEEVKKVLNQAKSFYEVNLSTIEMLRDTNYHFFNIYHYLYLQIQYVHQLLRLEDLDKIKRKYLFLHYKTKNSSIPKIKYELEYEVENVEKEELFKESFNKLNQLVGLENVKNTLEDIFSSILFKTKTSENLTFEKESKHMAFLGNPGTGKTTVAEIISPMLHKLGYVRSNKVAYVAAEDLVAPFVGQTAIKTKELITKNKGGIIVLDEAYILASPAQKFGNEAVAVILKEMEKNDTLFIFAGYEKEMEDFIKMNSGLKSRICSYIHFEDYSEKELLTMFMNRLRNTNKKKNTSPKNQLTITVKAMKNVREIIREGIKQEDFGNGRFIKNLFDQVITTHAKNQKDSFALDRIYKITEKDVPDNLLEKILFNEKNTSEYKDTTVGFGAKVKKKSSFRDSASNI